MPGSRVQAERRTSPQIFPHACGWESNRTSDCVLWWHVNWWWTMGCDWFEIRPQSIAENALVSIGGDAGLSFEQHGW